MILKSRILRTIHLFTIRSKMQPESWRTYEWYFLHYNSAVAVTLLCNIGNKDIQNWFSSAGIYEAIYIEYDDYTILMFITYRFSVFLRSWQLINVAMSYQNGSQYFIHYQNSHVNFILFIKSEFFPYVFLKILFKTDFNWHFYLLILILLPFLS